MKKIITICAFAACLTGCDDLFEPAIENNLGLEYMYENSQYAEGILANAYTRIPCAGYSFNDVATDDAVSNDAENSWRKIASGMWTANNNPAGVSRGHYNMMLLAGIMEILSATIKEMRVGPSQSVYRNRLQTITSCVLSNQKVVNVVCNKSEDMVRYV